MANPTCTFCEQYQGVLMATNLDNGDTVIPCGVCLPTYALGMAAGILSGMSAEDAKMYADAIDNVYQSDPRREAAQPAKRARKPKQGPAPEVAADSPERPAGEVVALPEPCQLCGSAEALGDDAKLTCRGCGAVIATATDNTVTCPKCGEPANDDGDGIWDCTKCGNTFKPSVITA